MGLFNKKKGTTITQEPMLTPEQMQALQALSGFSQTGKLGNYQAGEAYTGSLGDYTMTATEKAGQNKLSELVNGGTNQLFGAGSDEIMKLLTTDKFDPYAKGGVYAGFEQNLARTQNDASTQLKRNLAVTGDLYSTANAKEHGLLAERTQLQSSNKLAELYQHFSDQKVSAAGTAIDAGVKQEAIDQGRISLSQSAGALERLLSDAQAKAKYADYLRGRTEVSQQVDAAKTVLNKDVPYGVKSFTTPDSPSPFSNLLNAGLQIAGTAAGAYLTGGTSMLGATDALTGSGLFSFFA